MTRLRIRPGKPLRGRVQVAGDLHIGQQALLWAALAHGSSRVAGLGAREDHRRLLVALRSLGVKVEEGDALRIEGVGLRGLRMPTGALDAGESESTLVLLTALLAGQTFGTRVNAHAGALAASLRTLITPLRARGAHVAGKASEDGDVFAPVSAAPLLADELLQSVEIDIPSGDPHTKLGLLLSGLYARGVTAIREQMLSRDHVERALVALGLPLQTAAGMTLLDTSEGNPGWGGFHWQIPGDFTLASYLLAAGLIVPGSDLTVEGVGLNPTRVAWLEALRGTGARASVTPKGDAAGHEPVGEVRVVASKLTRVRVGGERAFGLLDEVPALAALVVACADRVSIRDVPSLRSREPDQINALRDLLARFGITCTSYEDGIEIDPPARLQGAQLDGSTPHALLGCVLGLAAEGETVVEGVERLDARYPGMLSALSALGADLRREEEL
jgi:3-phosphoshikimate 1-carboxyvinyltransferase